MRPSKHETVGRMFRAFGDKYRCVSYQPTQGFWVVLVEKGPNSGGLIDRAVGERACISERAIDRTYHRIYEDRSYIEHEQDCKCYVCRGDR